MEHEDQKRWANAVAATLRAERAVANLSQAEVARMTGIARSSYRLYEDSERQPDMVQLARIAQDAFKIEVSRLLAEISRRANHQAPQSSPH